MKDLARFTPPGGFGVAIKMALKRTYFSWESGCPAITEILRPHAISVGEVRQRSKSQQARHTDIRQLQQPIERRSCCRVLLGE